MAVAVGLCILTAGLLIFFLMPRDITISSNRPFLQPEQIDINVTAKFANFTVIVSVELIYFSSFHFLFFINIHCQKSLYCSLSIVTPIGLYCSTSLYSQTCHRRCLFIVATYCLYSLLSVTCLLFYSLFNLNAMVLIQHSQRLPLFCTEMTN